jgi:hypothetical protein
MDTVLTMIVETTGRRRRAATTPTDTVIPLAPGEMIALVPRVGEGRTIPTPPQARADVPTMRPVLSRRVATTTTTPRVVPLAATTTTIPATIVAG